MLQQKKFEHHIFLCFVFCSQLNWIVLHGGTHMDAYTLKAFAGTVQMECDALDKEKEIVSSKQGHSSTKLFC